jgi:hypothetical protein
MRWTYGSEWPGEDNLVMRQALSGSVALFPKRDDCHAPAHPNPGVEGGFL